MVRDIAKQLGRKVRFEIIGNDTRWIGTSWNSWSADHASPPERARSRHRGACRARRHGKPEDGHLKLEARHEQGMLSIRVSDDGHGIDVEVIRDKAVALGLTDGNTAARLSADEVLQFMFLPASRRQPPSRSCRGGVWGLDIVQTMVQKWAAP